MKRNRISSVFLAVALIGCGGGDDGSATDPHAEWFSSPDKVIQGLMYSYETRNDTLFAAFLADDFRYYFEPEDADSLDVLGWGKEEEVVGTVSLFHTPDVESLDYQLQVGTPRSVDQDGKKGWMLVPVQGGKMVISVKDKDPVNVILNRQEILLRPDAANQWKIVEWHDYPTTEGEVGGE